jgi:hypothetical protein
MVFDVPRVERVIAPCLFFSADALKLDDIAVFERIYFERALPQDAREDAAGALGDGASFIQVHWTMSALARFMNDSLERGPSRMIPIADKAHDLVLPAAKRVADPEGIEAGDWAAAQERGHHRCEDVNNLTAGYDETAKDGVVLGAIDDGTVEEDEVRAVSRLGQRRLNTIGGNSIGEP